MINKKLFLIPFIALIIASCGNKQSAPSSVNPSSDISVSSEKRN
jgi:hypothetical protein